MTYQANINRLFNGNRDNFYIIAEVGHNHQGNLEKCQDLFNAAKWCGVQAVKLQKRDNRTLYTRDYYNYPYENENSFGMTYGEHREFLEFGQSEYRELKDLTRELKLDFLCTAFDLKSVDFLEDVGIDGYKIASGDLRTLPLLRQVASTQRPILISTGGATLEDVRRAYDTIRPLNDKIVIFQCTASYPVEPQDMNLRVIETYRREFPDAVIGLSDHQNGIAMPLPAYMLGARMFEKHFTLNRSWKGTDHAFSLEPTGMHKLVRDLSRLIQALGDGEKKVLPMEGKPIVKMSKKLVAARPLSAGTVLTENDIALKSPGDGTPAYEFDHFLGQVLKRDLAEDENLTWGDVQAAPKEYCLQDQRQG